MTTYQDALNQGYRDADTTYQRGYVSRRADPMRQEIHTAGGNRKGQLYVLLPSRRTTQYCIRQYLTR